MTAILYLQSTAEIGGTDISLLRMIEKLDQMKFQPHVILHGESPLRGLLEKAGAKVFIMPQMLKLTSRKGFFYSLYYLYNYPIAVLKIARFIQAHKIKLVHTNTFHNLYGFLAAQLARVPHVWHIREIVMQSRWVLAVELFLAKNWGGRLIVTSDAVAAMFQDKNGRLPKNLAKIPNSIDTEIFNPKNSGALIRQELGLSLDTPLVGLICRLDHWKGVDTFLHAASLCHKELPHVHFLIAGGPVEGRESYADEMKMLSQELGLKEVITFTDWRYGPGEMPQVHAALSILVLASSWPEPFGLVLLEAMASGKPVIATDHGGPKEICVNEVTGFLVKPKDPKQMADAILRLLLDPSLAERMGQEGAKRVESLYNRTKLIRTLEQLYESLLNP